MLEAVDFTFVVLTKQARYVLQRWEGVFATSSINNHMLNAAHVTCTQVRQDQSVHKSD